MTESKTTGADDAMGKLAEAGWESWRAVVDVTARQQELGAKFAFAWFGSANEAFREQASNNLRIVRALTEQQARAFRTLSRGSIDIAGSLLGVSPVAGVGTGSVEEAASRDESANGRGLPIEDYDRLGVEEVGRRLEDLGPGEIGELKAYEKRHRNRASLLERLDRALV